MGREGSGGRDQVQSEAIGPDPQDPIITPGLLPGGTEVALTQAGWAGGQFSSDVRGCGARGGQ